MLQGWKMGRLFCNLTGPLLLGMVLLQGCTSTGTGLGADINPAPANTPTLQAETGQSASLRPANGRILGTGPVRVAMLLPQSADGFGALAAENFINSASLALREFDSNTVNIVVKDTGGTETGAANAAREALAEGAEVILGPVFSKNVPQVAAIARPAGVPVITFSNSTDVGTRGVYVFGFTPEPGIDRVVRYAGSTGSRSFAALLPNNAFGTLAEASFRESVNRAGGRIASILRYDYGNGEPAARAAEVGAVAASGQIDTIFIPDAGDVAPQLVSAVKQAAPAAALRFIGSGQWDDPRIFRDPALTGSLYPAPEREGYNQFAQRYNAAFGKPPIRLAGLGYDAASLVIILTQNFGAARFSEDTLTSTSGFKGLVDGGFRLDSSGRVSRALAVYEVTASGPRAVSPAPAVFAPTTN